MAEAQFSWKGGPTSRSLSFGARAAVMRSGAPITTDSSLDWTNALYATFGAKVGAYTPTKLKLWVNDSMAQADDNVRPGSKWIRLSNPAFPRTPADFTNGYMDRFYADFTNAALEMVPPGGLPTGHHYSLVAIDLKIDRGDGLFQNTDLLGSFSGMYSFKPEVVVDLPGYAGVFPSSGGINTTTIIAEDTSGSTVAVSPQALMPGFYDPAHPSGSEFSSKGIGYFTFTLYFFGDQYAVLNGDSPTSWASATFGSLQLPMAPFDVSPDAAVVKFRLNWDVTNLIEVYDNNTPGDKSDDVVVFAPHWWERITLVPEVAQ